MNLIGGALFQQFYNIVDTMIVGQFVGVDALAAVGATGSLNFLVIGFTLGLTNGFGIPIAKAFGAKKQNLVLNTITNAVYLCIAFAIGLTILMHFTTYNILEIMQTPKKIIQDSYNYIVIIFYGLTCTLAYNILASISRALGDSQTPLKFLILSSVLNIFLDLFMIINLHMGVRGAAIATIFSQGVSAILCFIYMWHKYPHLRFNKDTRRIRSPIILNLLTQDSHFKNGIINIKTWI
ncbi:MAG: polysaccharide biosynthesis C-terminal domain-containing protein, partial [Erysipelotrichaceae bacterium]|nr:polysaccharide biosynthesis C-terminal domain-containing protein [Erysipelotrichaceae bacterium]